MKIIEKKKKGFKWKESDKQFLFEEEVRNKSLNCLDLGKLAMIRRQQLYAQPSFHKNIYKRKRTYY